MGQTGMTTGDWLGALPPACAREIRTASVEPYITAMFAHLPQPIALDAYLPPDPAGIPLAARQLLKLALGGTQLSMRRIALAESLEITVSVGERQQVLLRQHFEQDLRLVAEQILAALCDRDDFLHVLEIFAYQSANFATLQRIISHMLESTDIDGALHAMLSGITAGRGLGFNRAALFTADEGKPVFHGAKAIGPADATEAARIWEEIEFADLSIDHIIRSYEPSHFDTPLQRFVQSLELRPERSDDEVSRALAPDAPLLFREKPRHTVLARLTGAPEFVLAAVRPHGKLLGLIFADNLFSRTPITPGRLQAIAFFIDQTAMVWENLLLLRRVEALARYDSLTGVLNRREFEARFREEVSRAQRHGSTVSLIVLDIDGFKRVNDTLGHPAGDEVLRRLGSLLREAVRGHELLGRFGGDEFLVLLPDTPGQQVALAAARIGALAARAGISLSVGCASWPGDCDDPDRLFVVADKNLYRAKHAGGGRLSCGGEPLPFDRLAEPLAS